MIVSKGIPWEPRNTMPENCKDGRDVLLAKRGPLGEWQYYVAAWDDDASRWRTGSAGSEEEIYLREDEAERWADINEPDD